MKSLLLGGFLSIIATVATAETLMVNSPGDGYLNLREGPSSKNPIIIEMYHGQTVDVLSTSRRWLRVRHQSGTVGWAYGKNLIPVSSAESHLKVNSPNDGYLNLRTGPSSKHQIVRQMKHGSRASVLGRSGDWLQIQHDSGSTGWAHSKYLHTSISTRNVASTGNSNSRNASRSSSGINDITESGGGLVGLFVRGVLAAGGEGKSSGSSNGWTYDDSLACYSGDTCFKILEQRERGVDILCTKGSNKGQEKCVQTNGKGKWSSGCGISDSFSFHHNSLQSVGNYACDW